MNTVEKPADKKSSDELSEIIAEYDERLLPSRSLWADVVYNLYKNKIATIGLLVFMLICLACLFAPFLTRWTFNEIHFEKFMLSPSREHILGTDRLGRDVFTRLLYGGRTTLQITFVSTVLATIVGTTIGLIVGYFGGWLDRLISGFIDTLASIPLFILVLACELALGWGEGNFMYAMAIAATPGYVRLVRASVMDIVRLEYIEASRALGLSHFQVITRHILHNIAPKLMVRFTSGATEALLLCSVMGYLGIGINPPRPEWGFLAYYGREFIRSRPSMLIIPCIAIIVTALSLNLFGDGLRDVLDNRES